MMLMKFSRRRRFGSGDGKSPFTFDDCSVIATALSQTCISGSDLAILLRRLAHDVEASQAATAKDEKEIERRTWRALVAEKSPISALAEAASLHGHIDGASTHDAELPSGALAASVEKGRATAELRQTCDKSLKKSRELAEIPQ